jgi:stalled ribosome alternative rescue factor ArfA
MHFFFLIEYGKTVIRENPSHTLLIEKEERVENSKTKKGVYSQQQTQKEIK